MALTREVKEVTREVKETTTLQFLTLEACDTTLGDESGVALGGRRAYRVEAFHVMPTMS